MNQNDVLPPDLQNVLKDVKKDIFSSMNCVQIGKIESVDNSKQTVSVALQIKRLLSDDSSVQIPVLVDCPYFVLSGGGAYIDMPIAAGDYCIVLFNDRDIDTWFDTGNVADPNSNRKHDLSDGIALIGISPSTKVYNHDGGIVRVLGTSGGEGSDISEAARKEDEIKSSAEEDSEYWAFFTKLNTFLSAWTSALAALSSSGGTPAGVVSYAGAVTTALTALGTSPSSLTGKITGGSSEVKIG